MVCQTITPGSKYYMTPLEVSLWMKGPISSEWLLNISLLENETRELTREITPSVVHLQPRYTSMRDQFNAIYDKIIPHRASPSSMKHPPNLLWHATPPQCCRLQVKVQPSSNQRTNLQFSAATNYPAGTLNLFSASKPPPPHCVPWPNKSRIHLIIILHCSPVWW